MFGWINRLEWAIVIKCNPLEDGENDTGGLLTARYERFVIGE